MAPRGALEDLGKRMIKAYNDWDIDAILGLRTVDCLHYPYPESTNRQPMKSRKEYEDFFRPVLPLLKNFTLHEINPPIIDTEQNRIAMHLRVTAELDNGLYEGEYLAMYTATSDATQFTHVNEFVDTTLAAKYAAPLIAKMQAQ